jgi:hypothetical protein
VSEGGPAGQDKRIAGDEQSRQRRAEVLALPMTPLRLHGYLDEPGHHPIAPVATGVGPDDIAVAAWPAPGGEPGVMVTSYDGNGPYSAARHRSRVRPIVSVVSPPTSLAVNHVQPLPGGKILIASARSSGPDNAEVWDDTGRLHHGFIGDAIKHLLTTGRGAIWAGYFDEGIFGGDPPADCGLARFTGDLAIDWAYPQRELPRIYDCYALNVSAETASICAYGSFHLVTVTGDQVRDHGQAPRRGAGRLLTAGEQAVLIGGYGPEYDLITPLQLTPAGVIPEGPQRRLVLPDGLEIPRGDAVCRGPDLHFFPRDSAVWYRLSLDDISS